MKLLAVETSTEACSAALFIDGAVAERFEILPQKHTRLILPMIDGLMAEAGLKPQQLDALALSRGPGSFTGVRIATGIIQGIAFGADLPVVPVSTLAAIAQDFFDRHDDNVSFTAMDARMGEIFWGVYRRDQQGYAELLGQEAVTPAEQVEFPALAGVGVGSGWGVYQDILMARLAGFVARCEAGLLPRAGAVARLGAYGFEQGLAVDVDQAMPVYLRDKVAKKESER
ncbi:tRNA (adenosine(37)-N6)-threonylcarbamoyltransferase complex dimerization subunit type 1 TsaB [Methylobacter sp. YRD-M1]|uniref:tRNA (adenosine(37)-N6)-threonylcarbamoyltransferase complex dimerization subunit type 1 TsaB n=1 Tax=Methylobacter sp. YRD-M1 TaxID=2911520 RepID=UPI00227B88CA|nr:tRNA (adenosine(37)-N6)-threonylcarbamoyltransferase complex dimerization subunit type 1 TsaB [Methylobacter sp. YRD-M1]WAK00838.1 tRNA (adenosine(37)-N6)-threonylcarbamoyltransferase complex dimerization subunit type 1 TsaB [Methylobacter sp. YRD-M1]